MASDARDIEKHLRAASDAILLLLTEVSQLERHKRFIRPGDPRFDDMVSYMDWASEGFDHTFTRRGDEVIVT